MYVYIAMCMHYIDLFILL